MVWCYVPTNVKFSKLIIGYPPNNTTFEVLAHSTVPVASEQVVMQRGAVKSYDT